MTFVRFSSWVGAYGLWILRGWWLAAPFEWLLGEATQMQKLGSKRLPPTKESNEAKAGSRVNGISWRR